MFLFITSVANASFSDVNDDNYYFDAINWAEENAIVNGYTDGTFKPDALISRAESTKILMETFFDQDSLSGDNCFSDVKEEWFSKYICFAKKKNIVNGYSDYTFKPLDNINFAEASKIIINTFKEDITEDLKIWYKPFIEELTLHGAIPMSISSVDKKLTRAEFLEILYRLENDIIYKRSMILNYNNSDLYADYEAYVIEDNILSYYGNILNNIDLDSFEILDRRSYSKDKNNVYFRGAIIRNAELNSFESLDYAYGKDENTCYYASWELENSDPSTFEVLEDHFAKDMNTAYFRGEIIDGSDGGSFETFGDFYARDDNYLYYGDEIIGTENAYREWEVDVDEDDVMDLTDMFGELRFMDLFLKIEDSGTELNYDLDKTSDRGLEVLTWTEYEVLEETGIESMTSYITVSQNGEKIFSRQMPRTSNQPIQESFILNGQGIFVFLKGTNYDIYYDGDFFTEKYDVDGASKPFLIDGKFGFFAMKDGKSFVFYDGEKVSPAFDYFKSYGCCASLPYALRVDQETKAVLFFMKKGEKYFVAEVDFD